MSLDYRAKTEDEFVIRGNAATLRCKVPSQVADFVHVGSWESSEGQTFFPSHHYGNYSSLFSQVSNHLSRPSSWYEAAWAILGINLLADSTSHIKLKLHQKGFLSILCLQ